MVATPGRMLEFVTSWPVRSQQGARRNALVAATALAERRRELIEVEEFLARHAPTRTAATLEAAVHPA